MSNDHRPAAERLFDLLHRFGRRPYPDVLEEIRTIYCDELDAIPFDVRREGYAELNDLVRGRELRSDAIMAVLFYEREAVFVERAAAAAAEVRAKPDDPMFGVRELAGYARECARHDDDLRAAAIFAGLANTADRRVLEVIGPCWRVLSADGRMALLAGLQVAGFAGVPEWLVSWLEDCEGDEFRSVAAVFAKFGDVIAGTRVPEIRRYFPPPWGPDRGRFAIVRYTRFLLYVDRFRARLMQLAADESPPRVMRQVLRAWSIGPSDRAMASVVRGPTPVLETHPLLELLPFVPGESDPPALLGDGMPVDDDAFAAHEGRLLALWAQFSRIGPVWFTLGVMHTEDPDVRLLFYRVLAPMTEESWILGVLRADDAASPSTLAALVESLFAREYVGWRDGYQRGLIGHFAPDLVDTVWEEALPTGSLHRAMLRSPALRQIDVVRALRELREFAGRPWERSTARIEDVVHRHVEELGPPPREGEATDAVISEWFRLVTSAEHRRAELRATPHAWHEALDTFGDRHEATTFTFWQLEEFLFRYGYRPLRESIEERAEL